MSGRRLSGRVVIIGSGETGPTMVPVLRSIPAERVVVLDGSYRFQTNAPELTRKIIDHLDRSIGWRARLAEAPDPLSLGIEIASADLVFAGPGSPTHALRHWNHPPVIDAMVSLVQRGGVLVMASAAALTLGIQTLPVYEIYKAGQDPYWVPGLDLLGRLGLEAVVIPHWNNQEGGTHDTSHCFIGGQRFEKLEVMLAPTTTVIGVDEHTALTLDFASGDRLVEGVGTATVREVGNKRTGEKLTRVALPAPREPTGMEEIDLPAMIPAVLEAAHDPDRLAAIVARLRSRQQTEVETRAGEFVSLLLDLREDARQAGRYEQSDLIRQQLTNLGVTVSDTPDGPTWSF